MAEVYICHMDNMRPDKPLPARFTGFRRVVLASDYDALAAELAAYRAMPASLPDRIRSLEQDVTDVAKINVDLMKRNRELEAALLQERNGPIVCMEHRWGNACPWCALHANNAEIERLRGIVSHQDAKLVEGQSQSETKAELAAGCHRSHPHEDMDAGCQRLTEIARTNNALARETNAEPAKLMPCWCPYCGEPHSPAVRETKGEQG